MQTENASCIALISVIFLPRSYTTSFLLPPRFTQFRLFHFIATRFCFGLFHKQNTENFFTKIYLIVKMSCSDFLAVERTRERVNERTQCVMHATRAIHHIRCTEHKNNPMCFVCASVILFAEDKLHFSIPSSLHSLKVNSNK